MLNWIFEIMFELYFYFLGECSCIFIGAMNLWLVFWTEIYSKCWADVSISSMGRSRPPVLELLSSLSWAWLQARLSSAFYRTQAQLPQEGIGSLEVGSSRVYGMLLRLDKPLSSAPTGFGRSHSRFHRGRRGATAGSGGFTGEVGIQSPLLSGTSIGYDPIGFLIHPNCI
jgi:hypothetical protein